MQCKPTSVKGHGYIIIFVDYFKKRVEAMPTFMKDGKIVALFTFNLIIARFGVPQSIVTDSGSHFQNHMMIELSAVLDFIMKIPHHITVRKMAK